MQGKADVVGHLAEKGLLFRIQGQIPGDRNRQKTEDPAGMGQAHGHRPPAGVLTGQRAVGAVAERILGDDHLGALQRKMGAMRQFAAFELVDQRRKIRAQTGMNGLQKPSRGIQQGDPGVVIAPVFDQVVADALKQPIWILLPGNELINPPNGAEHQIEMFYPIFHSPTPSMVLPHLGHFSPCSRFQTSPIPDRRMTVAPHPWQ